MRIVILSMLLMATGCSTLKQNMWDCYGCLGSLQSNPRESSMESGWQQAMIQKAEANDPEMAEKMKSAPNDPMDLWYTLDLHKAR